MTDPNLARLHARAAEAVRTADRLGHDALAAVAAANAPDAPPWASLDAEVAVDNYRLATARANAADDAVAQAQSEAAFEAREASHDRPLDPGTLTLVKAVQDHAHHNYNRGGWDIIVETFEDWELAEVIAGARTPAGAIRKAARLARLHDDRRADIQAEAF